MNKLGNFFFVILAIVIVGITCTRLYNNKLDDDFGIKRLNDLRINNTQLQSEIGLLDQDINQLQLAIDEKKKTKSEKTELKLNVEKQINDIEKAIYYLNKSLGRETTENSQ